MNARMWNGLRAAVAGPAARGRTAVMAQGLALLVPAAQAVANPWMDPGNVVVAATNFPAPGDPLPDFVPGIVVDRLGSRPLYLVRPARGATQGDVIGALAPTPSNGLGVVFRVKNLPVLSPESGGQYFGAVGNSVSAIGDLAELSLKGFPVYWTQDWLKASALAKISKGSNVVVGVLDTGVDPTHPNLSGRLDPGRDFVAPDAVPTDERLSATAAGRGYGHGTHVAGIVAQAAAGARILPVRVLDATGRGTLWTAAKGIAFALDPDGNPQTPGARVLNLSFGAPNLSPDEQTAMQTVVKIGTCDIALRNAQGLFSHPGFDADRTRCNLGGGRQTVVVAGEGNVATQLPLYPARFRIPGLIAVSASTQHGPRAPWTSRGAPGELAAPGELITSDFPGGRLALMNGTSMAAPWVSGLSALLLAMPAPSGGWTNVAVIERMRRTGAQVCRAPVGVREIAPLRALNDDTSSALNCR